MAESGAALVILIADAAAFSQRFAGVTRVAKSTLSAAAIDGASLSHWREFHAERKHAVLVVATASVGGAGGIPRGGFYAAAGGAAGQIAEQPVLAAPIEVTCISRNAGHTEIAYARTLGAIKNAHGAAAGFTQSRQPGAFVGFSAVEFIGARGIIFTGIASFSFGATGSRGAAKEAVPAVIEIGASSARGTSIAAGQRASCGIRSTDAAGRGTSRPVFAAAGVVCNAGGAELVDALEPVLTGFIIVRAAVAGAAARRTVAGVAK